MMKKVWPVLLAVVLVFGLAVLGCSSGSDPWPFPEPAPPGGGPTVLFKLKLADNFKYGDGYQGVISDILKASKNKTGDIAGKIEAGQTYAMRIKFTADRPLENRIQLGLVDTVTNYWAPLSWDGTNDATSEATGAFIPQADVDAATAEAPCQAVIQFTVLKSAAGPGADENSLVFQTNGEGTKGTENSGVKGAVTLSFYEFVFIKGTIDDLPEEVIPIIPDVPEGPFDIGAIEGGIELGVKNATFDDETKVASVPTGSDVLVYFSFLDAGYTFNINDTIKITYACILDEPEDATILPVSIKSGTSSYDDIATENYNNGIALTAGASNSFNVDMYRVRPDKKDGLTLQYNPWYGGAGEKSTAARLKILSVEKVTPASPFRVHFVGQRANGSYNKLAEVEDGVVSGGIVANPAGAAWLTTFLGDDILLGWKVLGTDADWNFATSTVTTNLALYPVVEKAVGPAPSDPTNPKFFVLQPFDDGEKTWVTNGVDSKVNEFTEEILQAAKYLILQVKNVSGQNGIGTVQIGLQGGTDWNWKDYTVTKGWSSMTWVDGSSPADYFIVIKLDSMAGWAATKGGGGAKIIYNSDNSAHIVFVRGLITSEDLVMPTSNAQDGEGAQGSSWIAKEVPEMWK